MQVPGQRIDCLILFLFVTATSSAASASKGPYPPPPGKLTVQLSQSVGVFTHDSVQPFNADIPVNISPTDAAFLASVVVQGTDATKSLLPCPPPETAPFNKAILFPIADSNLDIVQTLQGFKGKEVAVTIERYTARASDNAIASKSVAGGQTPSPQPVQAKEYRGELLGVSKEASAGIVTLTFLSKTKDDSESGVNSTNITVVSANVNELRQVTSPDKAAMESLTALRETLKQFPPETRAILRITGATSVTYKLPLSKPWLTALRVSPTEQSVEESKQTVRAYDNLLAEIKTAKEFRVKARQEIEKAYKQIENIPFMLTRLSKEIADQDGKVAEALKRAEDAPESLNEVEEAVDKATQVITNANTALGKAGETINDVKAQIAKANGILTQSNLAVSERRQKIDKLKQDGLKLTIKIDQASATLTNETLLSWSNAEVVLVADGHSFPLNVPALTPGQSQIFPLPLGKTTTFSVNESFEVGPPTKLDVKADLKIARKWKISNPTNNLPPGAILYKQAESLRSAKLKSAIPRKGNGQVTFELDDDQVISMNRPTQLVPIVVEAVSDRVLTCRLGRHATFAFKKPLSSYRLLQVSFAKIENSDFQVPFDAADEQDVRLSANLQIRLLDGAKYLTPRQIRPVSKRELVIGDVVEGPGAVTCVEVATLSPKDIDEFIELAATEAIARQLKELKLKLSRSESARLKRKKTVDQKKTQLAASTCELQDFLAKRDALAARPATASQAPMLREWANRIEAKQKEIFFLRDELLRAEAALADNFLKPESIAPPPPLASPAILEPENE